MTYLDYSATTPVDESVLESFNRTCLDYSGNANSLHELGVKSKLLMDSATYQMAKLLNINTNEIIYTSGATEANNLAIKGVIQLYKDRGKHIITTRLEHASVKETIKYLETLGYKISYVNLLDNGLIDLEHLKSLITDDTILVSICYVDSEIGILQLVNEIGELLKEYPRTIFHVDATQAVGKIPVDFNNIDLVSFSAHKFFGLKGIGCLIKRQGIELEPLFHGGKSQTKYRGGTPMLPLIVSMSKALRLSLENLQTKYDYVLDLNKKIKKFLNKYKQIVINSNDNSIPHILNISVLGIKPETLIHALDEHEIYISTKSACSDLSAPSESLISIHKTKEIASTSVRISLSSKTTEEEINNFFEIFDLVYNALMLKKGE